MWLSLAIYLAYRVVVLLVIGVCWYMLLEPPLGAHIACITIVVPLLLVDSVMRAIFE